MKDREIAFFDCSSGISGDMCLGALLDLGISVQSLTKELKRLSLDNFSIKVRNVNRGGIKAKKVNVIVDLRKQQDVIFDWDYISDIINRSNLKEHVKERSKSVFRRIFDAEAKVHGKKINYIHLHEIGALDSIVDIVGTIVCLDLLDIKEVYSSPINLGCGNVSTVHGNFPVPTPATIEILKGCKVYSKRVSCELTTPTGAAIIKEIARNFGDIPLMVVKRIGVGAGDNDFKDWPNVLRVFLGEIDEVLGEDTNDVITVIESNIDDMNPQIYEYINERLFKAGALDVYLTQIVMKKGRPGVKLTVLSTLDCRDILIDIILHETTSLGVRFFDVKRRILKREIRRIHTEFGEVRVKMAMLDDKKIRVTPEYEDCKRLSKQFNIPLIELMKRITCVIEKE
jgi:uncharacterized protein (TIGR00299 family) protein